MGKRQRKWARRAYEKLILQLGGRCARCGTLSGLSIHHIHGRDWDVRKAEWSARISVYRREASAGLLTVLCIKCNSSVGDPREIPTFPDGDGDQFDLFTYYEEDGRPYTPPEPTEDAPF